MDGRPRVLSAETAWCSGCHDAAIAPAVKTHSAAGRGIDMATSHPVDVLYPAGNRRFHIDPDPRLVLEEGRVTCRTCHGGSDPAKHFLSITESELCRACHNL